MSMWVTTRGCYGLKAMIELAAHHDEGPQSVAGMAGRLSLSPKYLHALLASLKRAGLVRSRQGCRGGYALTRPPERISVADVLRALEGELLVRECVADGKACPRSVDCLGRRVWAEVNREIEALLEGRSLAAALRRARAAVAAGASSTPAASARGPRAPRGARPTPRRRTERA